MVAALCIEVLLLAEDSHTQLCDTAETFLLTAETIHRSAKPRLHCISFALTSAASQNATEKLENAFLKGPLATKRECDGPFNF